MQDARRQRRRLAGLCLAALLLGSPLLQAANLSRVQIEGVEGDALANLRNLVGVARLSEAERLAITPARLDYLISLAPDEARRALQPYGFFSPRIDVQRREVSGATVVTIRVESGPPVRVSERRVVIEGEAAADADLAAAAESFRPRVEQVFDSRVYEASKSVLQRLLAERGYFEARETRAEVLVTRADASASIDLLWESGPRFRFGATRFVGNHLSERLVEAAVPYRQGELFEQGELLDLHARLSDLDYFGLIDVRPETEAAEDGEVPIVVSLSPGKRDVYSAGLSLGTDSGFGVKAGLERRWVNERGHKFATSVDIAQRRNALAAQYRIPAFAWAQGWYMINLNRREEDSSAARSEISELVLSRTGVWRDWKLSLATHVAREDFRFASEPRSAQRRSTLVYPALRAARSRGDDPLYPSRGYALIGELKVGSASLGSDVDFAQLMIEGRWLRSLGERNRLLLRGQLGRTNADQFDLLPPSLRFFAGGDRSLRGYGYQEIGPRNGTSVVGGRNLAVASIEFERMFSARWGGAVFVDSGDAFNDRFEARTGVGLGLRWRSPVGPVRLDLGRGLDRPNSDLRIHLSIGPDL